MLAALRALPPIHREVLVTTYVAGLTTRRPRRVLGVARGTVMSRVFRARSALVQALGGAVVATSH